MIAYKKGEVYEFGGELDIYERNLIFGKIGERDWCGR